MVYCLYLSIFIEFINDLEAKKSKLSKNNSLTILSPPGEDQGRKPGSTEATTFDFNGARILPHMYSNRNASSH